MKIPQYIAEAALARVRQTQSQRQGSLKAIAEGRPLDAETIEGRKIARLQNLMKVGVREAKDMASYEFPIERPLPKSLRGKEIVQGATTDFLDVAFLETAVYAAGTVARVAYYDGRPRGSGFMVSEKLFLTNHHVIETADQARQFMVEFDYQLDYRGRPRNSTRFALAPEVFFLTSPEAELDFTMVAVGQKLEGAYGLDWYGYCPLLPREDKHMLGELVNVIQHPEGNYKQAVIRENKLVARLKTVLHYVADTMPGSSGSPVFNDQWEAVALHHWGGPFTETVGPDGKPVSQNVNEGIRISAIVSKLTSLRPQLSSNAAKALLDAVIEPKVQYPSTMSELMTGSGGAANGNGAPLGGGALADKSVKVGKDGSATWTLPLQVSVKLGGIPAPVPAPAGPTEPVMPASIITEPAAEKVQIDTNYSNRRGYDQDFLPGFRIPLPKLSSAQQAVAAKLKNPKPGADPQELKYTRFSIKMNAKRRMAFFTVCNIDGSSWVDIDRKTGQPREIAEAAENWEIDPRIDADAQCDQGLYDNQKPKRIFDRGHLVRRQDPAWGTDKMATRANADTFHFTNCTPQASTFNQSAKFWQGIEQYILEHNAVADGDRVTVFTGPVLGKNDKPYRDIFVPKQFWKIIVRVQEDQLMATALLADQSKFIKKMPEGLEEAWDDTEKVEEFLSTVKRIETLTGLDFGNLSDHDTNAGAEGLDKPLSSFEDFPLQPYHEVTTRPAAPAVDRPKMST